MLFKVVSFHPFSDGTVCPRTHLFIEASTWFNAKRVVGRYLGVPSDDILLKMFEGTVPAGSVFLDERKPDVGRMVQSAKAA